MTPRPPSDVTSLHGICQAYLDACQAALATTEGGSISRAFVSPNAPAWDCCPQLSVHAGGPVITDTMPLTPILQPALRKETGVVNMAAMTATVIRCAPTQDGVDAIPPATLTAAALVINEDVWAIWNHLRELITGGVVPWEKEVLIDPAVPLPSQGGCVGWQIQVRVYLPGYRVIP